MTLETTLADLRERVTMLRVEGHPVQAASVERAIEQMVACLPEYLVLLSEGDAVTYTGRSPAYLRARFGAWQSRGLAEWKGRVRYYRRCVLEHRGNADIAREAGRRAAA